MKKKAYASVGVNRVRLEAVAAGHEGQSVVVGLDVGKREVRAMLRWQSLKLPSPRRR